MRSFRREAETERSEFLQPWSWWTDSNPRPADYKDYQERPNADFKPFLALSADPNGDLLRRFFRCFHWLISSCGSPCGSEVISARKFKTPAWSKVTGWAFCQER